MTEDLTTLTDKAYRTLRRDIVAGTLAPNDRLRISALVSRYGIGASPLREALSRLSSEFLVIFEGQRGFSVAPIRMTDVEDVSQIRSNLEGEMLRRAIAAGGDDWEAGIVAAFYNLGKADVRRKADPEGSLADWEDKNRAFHEALIAACPSDWLKSLHRMLYYQHERYRRISLSNPDPGRDLHGEHRAIMEAALARDGDAAVRLSQEHIARTTSAVLEAQRSAA